MHLGKHKASLHTGEEDLLQAADRNPSSQARVPAAYSGWCGIFRSIPHLTSAIE